MMLYDEFINKENNTYKSVLDILNKYDVEEIYYFTKIKDEYVPEAIDIINRCFYEQ